MQINLTTTFSDFVLFEEEKPVPSRNCTTFSTVNSNSSPISYQNAELEPFRQERNSGITCDQLFLDALPSEFHQRKSNDVGMSKEAEQFVQTLLAKMSPCSNLFPDISNNTINPVKRSIDSVTEYTPGSMLSTPCLDHLDTPYTAASSVDFDAQTPYEAILDSMPASPVQNKMDTFLSSIATAFLGSSSGFQNDIKMSSIKPFTAAEAMFGSVPTTPAFQSFDFDTDFPEAQTGLSRESSGLTILNGETTKEDVFASSVFFAPREEVLSSSQEMNACFNSTRQNLSMSEVGSAESQNLCIPDVSKDLCIPGISEELCISDLSQELDISNTSKDISISSQDVSSIFGDHEVKSIQFMSKTKSGRKRNTKVAFLENGEPLRRFQCPLCDRPAFARKYNLDQHILTHNKDRQKAFVCKHCPRQFSRKHDLHRHLDSVHKTMYWRRE